VFHPSASVSLLFLRLGLGHGEEVLPEGLEASEAPWPARLFGRIELQGHRSSRLRTRGASPTPYDHATMPL